MAFLSLEGWNGPTTQGENTALVALLLLLLAESWANGIVVVVTKFGQVRPAFDLERQASSGGVICQRHGIGAVRSGN